MVKTARPDPLVLDAGDLRNKIDIQAQANVPDLTTGMPQQTWTTVRSCYAKISTASTREAYQASQFVAQVSHVVTFRWSPIPLRAGMRVVFGPRIFVVQAAPENVMERNRVMKLTCLEIDGVST